MAPVIHQIEALLGDGSALVINTGQHYDQSMSGQFWPELGLAAPEVCLDGGGLTRAECIGSLTYELGRLFARHRPAAVLVQGDTNTTVAAALAANGENIPLVHVEAGLRSFDRAMPEEHNRVVTDHLADLCCAATPANVSNLLSSAIPADRVALTGNTIVEAVQAQLPTAPDRAAILGSHGLTTDRYILATIHRPENTDDPENLATILIALAKLSERMPVVFPLHPRTRIAAKLAGVDIHLESLRVLEPVGAREFLALAAHAAVLISDSGGVAEEVTVLKRPLVVVRRSTERAESIDAGFAQPVRPPQILDAVASVLDDHDEILARLARTPSPYGDGNAASLIARFTLDLVSLGDQVGPPI